MAKSSAGRWLSLFKTRLTVPLSILGLIVIYVVVGPIDRALSRLSQTFELAVLLAAGACALACWHIARHHSPFRRIGASWTAASTGVSAPTSDVAAEATRMSPPRVGGPIPQRSIEEVSDAHTEVELTSSTTNGDRPIPGVTTADALPDASRGFEQRAPDVRRVLGQLATTCGLLADQSRRIAEQTACWENDLARPFRRAGRA